VPTYNDSIALAPQAIPRRTLPQSNDNIARAEILCVCLSICPVHVACVGSGDAVCLSVCLYVQYRWHV